MEIDLLAAKEAAEGITFKVKVQPRASRCKIAGIIGDALKLQLTSPPVEGAANAACIEFLAQIFEVAKSRVVIASGEKSRDKVIRISGLTKERFITQLLKQNSK